MVLVHGRQVQVQVPDGNLELGRGKQVEVRGKRGPACKRVLRSCCLASSRAPSPRRPR